MSRQKCCLERMRLQVFSEVSYGSNVLILGSQSAATHAFSKVSRCVVLKGSSLLPKEASLACWTGSVAIYPYMAGADGNMRMQDQPTARVLIVMHDASLASSNAWRRQ